VSRHVRRERAREPLWGKASDDELCALRFRDLKLRLEGTSIQDSVERLYGELARRGIGFTPPAYLSSDWFSPDGVPGIAVPFYLAHPRLVRLERAKRLTVEGAGPQETMRLLRHEAGHALDTAYGLGRRRGWREVFGKRSTPYRARYRVDPWSLAHVQHLPQWYAQSHPADDFAETFAVWLAPRSGWRRRYADRAAIGKLEYVDRLVSEIRDSRPRVTSRERPWSLSRLDRPLGEHYARKHRQLTTGPGAPFDADLFRLFVAGRPLARSSTAAAYLRRRGKGLVTSVSRETGVPPYSAQQVLDAMILRVRELGLRLNREGGPPSLASVGRSIAKTLRRLKRGRQLLIR